MIKNPNSEVAKNLLRHDIFFLLEEKSKFRNQRSSMRLRSSFFFVNDTKTVLLDFPEIKAIEITGKII
jgi:hypothetical protein